MILGDPHMQAIFHILQYLKSASMKGLFFFGHGHLQIKAFVDVDWAGSPDDSDLHLVTVHS